jgi:hypothetical protein
MLPPFASHSSTSPFALLVQITFQELRRLCYTVSTMSSHRSATIPGDTIMDCECCPIPTYRCSHDGAADDLRPGQSCALIKSIVSISPLGPSGGSDTQFRTPVKMHVVYNSQVSPSRPDSDGNAGSNTASHSRQSGRVTRNSLNGTSASRSAPKTKKIPATWFAMGNSEQTCRGFFEVGRETAGGSVVRPFYEVSEKYDEEGLPIFEKRAFEAGDGDTLDFRVIAAGRDGAWTEKLVR